MIVKRAKNIRGNIALVIFGIATVLVISTASKENPIAYSQLAAVTPSAAEQIWQIGNQPLPDWQAAQGTHGASMWDLDSSYQNIQFLNSSGVQSGRSDIWNTLNAEVQSSQSDIANNPLQGQSTFEGPAPLSNFEMRDAFSGQTEETSSWWSTTWNSFGGWSSGVVNDVRGWLGFSNEAENPCPDGVCDALGIRG